MVICSAGSSDDDIDQDLQLNDDLSTAFRRLSTTKHQRATNEAFQIRNQFRDYFTSPAGEISWQNNVKCNNIHDSLFHVNYQLFRIISTQNTARTHSVYIPNANAM